MLYELGPRARRVYERLLGRIRSGELAPGTRLPPHTQLAASFGVAPLTVRQVLARLEADKLLVRERGRGTFVRGAATAQVLIVAAEPEVRSRLADEVGRLGRRALLAATPAEGLAALEREARPALVVVDLRLPAARDGLTFVRRLRTREPELPVAVVNPTPRQRTRLEHTVAPPPVLVVGDPPLHHLSSLLEVVELEQPPAADLVDRYLALQVAGEGRAARQLVLHDGFARGLSVAELYTHVLQPAQYRVGELWQANQLSVAREHLATALTQSLLVQAAVSAPRAEPNTVPVLVACVEGELHDVGARMVAELLELDGFAVRFLGADVPTDSLLTMLLEDPPRLLVLSATMPDRRAQVEQTVTRARQALGSQLAIFIGGQILDRLPHLPHTLEVDVAAEDALDTLEQARRRFSRPAAAS